MSDRFSEMVSTLEQARRAVSAELEPTPDTCGRDVVSLVHLIWSVQEFAKQADALLLTMMDHDEFGPQLDGVEELGDFFRNARTRVAAVIGLGEVGG
jgi:hypothetical protein